MRTIEFLIDENSSGVKIRDYLRNFGVSSSLLTKLKNTENGITKNGVFAKTIEMLETGDVLRIIIENSGHMPTPTKMDIEVCYEDDDILVLNKPAFLPVHESLNHRGDTLSNFVSYYLNEDTAFRAVFRLDRDTSGLILIAKHELSASKLAGKIKKDYYAVVEGEIKEGGTINLPIARCGESIIKRRVDSNGERAVTHYEPVSHKNSNTLLKINLETGRTHQIRVHFSHIGHPLLGDELYGGSTALINRQALHCKAIYFTHPVTEKEIAISCDFPEDIKKLI
ncbi:MAG: RluA family pseudouridine synthase [Ruminococcaceae bacterium]|nr:RluA family pseudouridine synthase [Oscillospiraceae bacterium]